MESPMLLVIVSLFISGVTSQINNNCPLEWHLHQDNINRQHCYRFIAYPTKSFDEANLECMVFGAALISVNTLEEHSFVINYIQQNFGSGTGVNNQDVTALDWYTSGLDNVNEVQATTVKFYWRGDGTAVNYNEYRYWHYNREMWERDRGASIIYHYNASTYNENPGYGWSRNRVDKRLPYICEIPLSEVYRIQQEERDYFYGRDPTEDKNSILKGPYFTLNARNTIIIQNEGNDNVAQDVDLLWVQQGFLECVANGNPAPEYAWYKATNIQEHIPSDTPYLVQPSEDYIMTNGRLTIKYPESGRDAGYYQCRAKNDAGTILSNPIRLLFGSIGSQPNVEVADTTVNRDQGGQVVCPGVSITNSVPALRFQWTKTHPQQFLRPEHQEHIFISQNGKLYFSRVTTVDAGRYFCIASLATTGYVQGYLGSERVPSTTSLAVTLTVLESAGGDMKPDIQDDFIFVYPSTPTQGQNLRMECFAYGTGPLRYTWVRLDSRDMPRNVRYLDHNRVLEIIDLQLDDSGRYRCDVYSSKTLQSDSTVLMLTVNAKPHFTVPLTNQFPDKGTQFTWRGYAEAVPPAKYTWYKDGDILSNSGNQIKIAQNVITFTNLDPASHDGMYQLAATNDQGTTYSTAQLNVLLMPPTFQKQPQNQIILSSRGGNVTIPCGPEGAPRPQFTWQKNGGDIGVQQDQNCEIALNSNRQCVLYNGDLLMTDVQNGDRGTYTCVATNSEGEARLQSELRVLDGTQITRKPQRSQQVKVNETAFLYCRASHQSGLDMIYIWTFNGVPITIAKDAHFTWGTGVDSGGLYVRNAQVKHEGRYACIARTQADEVKAETELNVVGPPGPPSGVYADLASIRNTSMRIKWTDGVDHGAPITYYTVEGATNYDDFLDFKVLKANIRKSDTVDLSSLTPEEEKPTTIVDQLNPGTQYTFRVRALNTYGIGESSPPSEISTTNDAPPVKAPEDVGGGGGKVADLTITWKLLDEVEHHGRGKRYRVFWRKKGLQISEEDWNHDEVAGDADHYVTQVPIADFYMEYEAKVQALNDMGQGPNSSVVVIFSAEDLPTGIPGTPYGDTYNSTAITITWEPVSDTREVIRGKLIGYKINYWRKDDQDESHSIQAIYSGQLGLGLLIGLEPDTFYRFNVMAYNSAGNGPKSNDYEQTTFHLRPQHYPTEVSVHSVENEQSIIEVRWRGVSTNQGEEPLQGYKIRYWPAGLDIRNATDSDCGLNDHGFVYNLKRDQLYYLRVLGYSRAGDGKMSMPNTPFALGHSQILYDPSTSQLLALGSTLIPSFYSVLLGLIFILITKLL